MHAIELSFTYRKCEEAEEENGSAKRVNTDIPSIVTEYNKYMGGVDKADQMKAAYAFDHRAQRKYYL